jgi:hypothetical protein
MRNRRKEVYKHRLLAVERQRKALELRLADCTYEEIAHILGYATSMGAWKAVDSALKKTLQDPAEKVRTQERARLQRLFKTHWPKALKGDARSTEICLKIMNRRAALDGLDAEKTLNVTGGVNVRLSDSERVAAIQSLLARMGVSHGSAADGKRNGGGPVLGGASMPLGRSGDASGPLASRITPIPFPGDAA